MSTPLVTYAPLVNQKHLVTGLHLRIHAGASSETETATALQSWQDCWPTGYPLVLVDLITARDPQWPAAWQPHSGVVMVSDSTSFLVDLGYLRLGAAAPKLCLRSAEVPSATDHQIGYVAAVPGTLSTYAAIPQKFRRHPLLVLDVDEPFDQTRAQSAGATACGGWSCLAWTRKPVDKKVGMLSTIFKVLQLIDKDADSAEIEMVLKRDAVLSYKLVSMANVASFGLSVEVTSIKHALSMLGRDKLKNWLALLLIHAGGNDTPQVLLQTSFVRAAMLESLGATTAVGTGRDDLFLCGAFSLLDKILGIPFAELLARVSISDEITEALLEGSGPLAPLLGLVTAVERRDAAALRDACQQLLISPDAVCKSLFTALGSARDLSAI